MRDKITQVEALGKRFPTRGNMTENISRIKDLVQETRSYLNRVTYSDMFFGGGFLSLRSRLAIISLHRHNALVDVFSGHFLPRHLSNLKVALRRHHFSQLSLATRFTGKSHIELHPPSDAEDAKAFTAVDLLLSVEQKSAEHRRKRQDKWRDDNMFVLYLGADDVSNLSRRWGGSNTSK